MAVAVEVGGLKLDLVTTGLIVDSETNIAPSTDSSASGFWGGPIVTAAPISEENTQQVWRAATPAGMGMRKA